MILTLPYHFDSSGVVRLILVGVVALLLLLIAGSLYVLFVRQEPATALPLLLSGAVLAYFGRRFYKHLEGSRGVITIDAIHVEPTTLYGVTLPGPVGQFSIQQFEKVRVEYASGSIDVQGHGSEAVRFVGKRGTPDILIARIEPKAGKILGRQLATAVGLPYEEGNARY